MKKAAAMAPMPPMPSWALNTAAAPADGDGDALEPPEVAPAPELEVGVAEPAESPPVNVADVRLWETKVVLRGRAVPVPDEEAALVRMAVMETLVVEVEFGARVVTGIVVEPPIATIVVETAACPPRMEKKPE